MNVFICSGGLDSSSMALVKGDKKKDVVLFFRYGQKHYEREYGAFKSLFQDWTPSNVREIDICSLFSVQTNCTLLEGNGEVPVGPYGESTITSLEVKNRNLIFILTASSIPGATKVWYGAHANDSVVYPDCRPEFVKAAQEILNIQGSKVEIVAPHIDKSKAGIVKWFVEEHGNINELGNTYSCYNGRLKHCGTCPTCEDRKKAFIENNVEDLTEYEV